MNKVMSANFQKRPENSNNDGLEIKDRRWAKRILMIAVTWRNEEAMLWLSATFCPMNSMDGLESFMIFEK